MATIPVGARVPFLGDGRYVIMSDTQVPYHNPKMLEAVTEYIKHETFDGYMDVGDSIDFPQISQWHKNLKGEYAGTLQKDIDTNYGLRARLREAMGDKPMMEMDSNHVRQRLIKYVEGYAPALASLRSLEISALLRYDELGIDYHLSPYEYARNAIICHGNEFGVRMTPGSTASGAVLKTGMSVICGHTHRAALIPMTKAVLGASVRRHTQTAFGMEVGNLMKQSSATYLGGGMSNWTCAFGIVRIDKGVVFPQLIVIQDGKFIVDNVVYKIKGM